MAILNQKRILNLIPKVSAPVTIHVSQGDVGAEIEFTLVKGDEVFVNPGNVSASVHGVREDGANFGPFTCTLSGSKVTFPLHSEMTAVKGSALAEIVLVNNGGNKVGSANFGILVEEAVFPLGVTYDNDVSVYESILAYVQTIPAQLTDDYTSKINHEIVTRTSADALINTRIDQIIAPTGEAPNPAEITDARIDANNTTYRTLGEAIRTQTSKRAALIYTHATSIPANSDLNNYTLSGTYHLPLDIADVRTILNMPINYQGLLYVLVTGEGLVQVYISKVGYIYTRRKTPAPENIWEDWRRFSTISEVENQISKHAALAYTHATNIPANSDLNDYVITGTYYYNDDVRNTLLNTPNEIIHGTLYVLAAANSYERVQIILSTYGYIYSRWCLDFTTKDWRPWKRVSVIGESDSISYGRHNAIAAAKQMIDIEWTPIRPIPVTNSAGFINANTPCKGLPYSSTRSVCKYIGQHVSIYTFMSALQNPESVLYKRRIKYGTLGKTYYGVTCFTVTSYATGSQLGTFDNERTPVEEWYDEISPYEIEIGDVVLRIFNREGVPTSSYGHAYLIYNITKDLNGRITSVTIAEGAPPFVRVNNPVSFNDFLNTYVHGTYEFKVYRSSKKVSFGKYIANGITKGYDDEVLTDIIYPDIMPEYGDKACIEEGTNVRINVINPKTYNAITIYKNEELIRTIRTIEDFTMEQIAYGKYEFVITDGVNESKSSLIVVNTVGSYEPTTKRITFSSANATPVFAASYAVSGSFKGVQNMIKYFTEEEKAQGWADMIGYVGTDYPAVQIGYSTDYGIAMWWSEKLTDEWEYWTPPTA